MVGAKHLAIQVVASLANAAAGAARLAVLDDGNGNMTLAVRFPTGTSTVLATEGVPAFRRYSSTSNLNFPSIAAGAESELSITGVTGAAVGDAVYLGPPDMTAYPGISWNAYVIAADTVRVRVRNNSGAAIDLPSATWRATIIK